MPERGEASDPAFQAFVTGCVKPGTLPASLRAPFPPTTAQVQQAWKDFFADPEGYTRDQTQPVIVPPDPRRCYLAKDASHFSRRASPISLPK
jgi:hypothetical protein